MSRLCRFFVILIAAYTAAGCSPVGNIGGSDIDLLWAVPSRLAYNSGDLFTRNDLEVLALYQGVTTHIPTDQVEIGIADNPYLPNELEKVPNTGLILQSTGNKIVVVKYRSSDCRYNIVVSASNPPGIHIKWPE